MKKNYPMFAFLKEKQDEYYDSDDGMDKTFEEFVNLSEMDLQKVKNEIFLFDEEMLKEANRVFSKWYSLKVPQELTKMLLQNNLSLAMEVYNNSIADTCAREILIDSLMNYMGVGSWPSNADGQEHIKKFVKDLKEKCFAFNVEMI